jgi:hypothetical protein
MFKQGIFLSVERKNMPIVGNLCFPSYRKKFFMISGLCKGNIIEEGNMKEIDLWFLPVHTK